MENQKKEVKKYEDDFVSPSEEQTDDPDMTSYPSEITNFSGVERKKEESK